MNMAMRGARSEIGKGRGYITRNPGDSPKPSAVNENGNH